MFELVEAGLFAGFLAFAVSSVSPSSAPPSTVGTSPAARGLFLFGLHRRRSDDRRDGEVLDP